MSEEIQRALREQGGRSVGKELNMGLFSHRHDDDAEREAVRRHRDAQQRLADARRHQQERQQASVASAPQPSTHTATPAAARQQSSYPETSWRKEFDLYVVRKGDTLSAISRQAYGNANDWHRIQQANPIVLKNPDLIHPGLVLRIPRGEGKPLA